MGGHRGRRKISVCSKGVDRVLAAHIATWTCMPPKDGTNLPDFTLSEAHLLLREVYRYHQQHKEGSHLGVRVSDNNVCQRYWLRMTTQLTIWYSTPQGEVRHRFMAILAAEFWEF